MEKGGCFEKTLQWRVPNFFRINDRYKASFVKILIFW